MNDPGASTPETRLLDALLAGLNAGIVEFRMNPYRFLYEFDIQSMLFCHLRKCVPASIRVRGSRKEYVLGLVYTEQPRQHHEIDLACLDPVMVATTESYNRDHSNDNFIYQLPLLLGVDLKYAVMGLTANFCNPDKSCLKDWKNLQAIKEGLKHCLVLGFLQSTEIADCFYKTVLPNRLQSPQGMLLQLDGVFLVAEDGIREVCIAPGQ